MDELEFAAALGVVVEEAGELDGGSDTAAVRSVRSFESAGLMSGNAGLVVWLESGEEFQVTVVRRK